MADGEVLTARPAPAGVADLVHLARFLDNAFVIPGTNIRFGMDGLLGLIPGAGDALSALISLYIIGRAKALGAPEQLLNKMRWNVVIDTVAGAVPFLGDLFDVAFKSNIRNVRLLLEHLGVEADLGDGRVRRRRRP
ncbi:MAG: DUF4112 domain-containing protein [Vitreimonas sp.]